QDIAHSDREGKLSSVPMSWVRSLVAGFQVTISGRFWVITEVDSCYADDHPIQYDALEERISEDRSLDRMIAFFDGLTRGEERYRWDRMVALHLFVVAFINKFGYCEQRSTTAQISEIVAQFKNPEIASNLIDWMPRLGLTEVKEFRQVNDAIKRHLHVRKRERALAAASPR
ncbi:MAG: hypothetical protein ABSH46_06700, partial [Bryobacteraceae bacterium]